MNDDIISAHKHLIYENTDYKHIIYGYTVFNFKLSKNIKDFKNLGILKQPHAISSISVKNDSVFGEYKAGVRVYRSTFMKHNVVQNLRSLF